MLIYTQVENESAPEALLLSGPDATVQELVTTAGARACARGRLVVPPFGTAPDDTRLADLGVRAGHLVVLGVVGDPQPVRVAAAVSAGPATAAPAAARRGRGARLSEYEELTQLLQWHAPYYIDGDTPALKVWTDDSTVLRSVDWEAYRSPDKLYYRTYAAAQAKAERAVRTAFEFAEEDRQLAAVDPEHLAHLRDVLPALQYPDWALCVLHQHTTRFALSSWIAGAAEFMMFDELRHAQLYGRLTLAHDEAGGGFDRGSDLWTTAARFQPTRQLVEELMAVLDWGQGLVVAGLVVEPLLTAAGQTLLRHGGLAAGDALSTFVCQSITRDKVRHRASADAFLSLVVEDPDSGAHNREQVGRWVESWLPRAVAAATALADGHAQADRAVSTVVAELRGRLDLAGVPGGSVDTALAGTR